MTNEPVLGQGESLEGIVTPSVRIEAGIVTDPENNVMRVGFRASEINEQIVITEKQAKRLEQLVASPSVESVVKRIESIGVDPNQGNFKEYLKSIADSAGTLTNDEKRIIIKGFNAIHKRQADYLKATTAVYGVREKHVDGERVHEQALLAAYREAYETLQAELRRVTEDPKFIKLKRFFSSRLSTCTPEEQKLIMEGRRKYSMLEGELTLAALSLKLERLDALMGISRLNAARYATAGLPNELVTPELKAQLDQEMDVDKDGIHAYQKFWGVDTEVYRTIINRFQIAPRAQPTREKSKPIVVEPPKPVVIEPEPVTYESMRTALFGSLSANGRRKSQDTFLDYALINSGMSQDQLRSLQKTGIDFVYADWMRRRPLTPAQEDYFWNQIAILIEGRKSSPRTDLVSKREFRDTYQASLAYRAK